MSFGEFILYSFINGIVIFAGTFLFLSGRDVIRDMRSKKE